MWQPANVDATGAQLGPEMRCTKHGEVFAPPAACGACGVDTVEDDADEMGHFERLNAEARTLKLPTRLMVEADMARHATTCERFIRLCSKRARLMLGRSGDDGVDPESDESARAWIATGARWAAEAGKARRAQLDMVADRERRGDQERLARLVEDRDPAARRRVQ